MKIKFLTGYTKISILFWAALVFMFWIQIYSNYLPLGEATLFIIVMFTPIFLVSSYLTNQLLPRAMKEKRMKIFVFHFFSLSLLGAILFYCTTTFFRILELNGYITQSELFTELDPYWREILSTCPSIILVNAAFCGLRFYYEHSKLQEAHLESQLQMLKAQVNPHFMFNVLNHIHILIRKDVDLASFLLEKYSEILRYQIYNTKKELVPLTQDVQFVKDVVSIERLRWGDDLLVNCEWSIEDGDIWIEPLLLITFIENAFKHVSRSMTDKGYINIVLRQSGNILYLEVENSKSKYAGEKSTASGLGLKNIKERLKLLYPNKYTLWIEETDWVYRVELTIILK